MVDLDPSSLRHVRRVRPLHFPTQEPDEEHLGQSTSHLKLCHALYDLLLAAVDPSRNTIGADQFVYWNGADPRRCLAPDGFVKLGVPDHELLSYKTWIEGVPELAIEILSPSNTKEKWSLPEKVRRYRELGVRELIVFNSDKKVGARIRAWDRIKDDLIEREVTRDRTACSTLKCWVLVGPVKHLVGLRFSRDREGRSLILLPHEELGERARQAEARIAELEAENARLKRKKR